MILRSLDITNFKNIESAQLLFSEKLNCFLGDNGMGKSNLLDAIYYLSFIRSFSGASDGLVIRRGEDFAILRGVYDRRGIVEDVNIGLGSGSRRKSVKRGGKEYKRFSAHIGVFPTVLVSPSDMDLVTGPGEVRRRFMDMVISQGDTQYLDALIKYNGALDNRNRLLRDDSHDTGLFLAYETAMDMYGKYITDTRRSFVERLGIIHRKYYSAIASGNEATSITLATRLDNEPDASLADCLEHHREHDRAVGYTAVGPHRDDLVMTLDTMPVRRTASQGQSKTFTIALRLAQYIFLCDTTGVKPLLLLDDIFDKLDSRRVENIIDLVSNADFGQIFITDTNRKNLDEILRRHPAAHALWNVTNGVFTSDTAGTEVSNA